MNKIIPELVAVIICFSVGVMASYFQVDAIQTWYPFLNKPSLTPPNFIFPIVWSILYFCMGISIGLIWNTKHRKRKILRWLFSFQLLLNFTWSIYFFYFQNPFLGFIDILLLDIFVIYYMMKSYSIKKMSSLLFIPYILWLLLATYLNGYIMLYN